MVVSNSYSWTLWKTVICALIKKPDARILLWSVLLFLRHHYYRLETLLIYQMFPCLNLPQISGALFSYPILVLPLGLPVPVLPMNHRRRYSDVRIPSSRLLPQAQHIWMESFSSKSSPSSSSSSSIVLASAAIRGATGHEAIATNDTPTSGIIKQNSNALYKFSILYMQSRLYEIVIHNRVENCILIFLELL